MEHKSYGIRLSFMTGMLIFQAALLHGGQTATPVQAGTIKIELENFGKAIRTAHAKNALKNNDSVAKTTQNLHAFDKLLENLTTALSRNNLDGVLKSSIIPVGLINYYFYDFLAPCFTYILKPLNEYIDTHHKDLPALNPVASDLLKKFNDIYNKFALVRKDQILPAQYKFEKEEAKNVLKFVRNFVAQENPAAKEIAAQREEQEEAEKRLAKEKAIEAETKRLEEERRAREEEDKRKQEEAARKTAEEIKKLEERRSIEAEEIRAKQEEEAAHKAEELRIAKEKEDLKRRAEAIKLSLESEKKAEEERQAREAEERLQEEYRQKQEETARRAAEKRKDKERLEREEALRKLRQEEARGRHATEVPPLSKDIIIAAANHRLDEANYAWDLFAYGIKINDLKLLVTDQINAYLSENKTMNTEKMDEIVDKTIFEAVKSLGPDAIKYNDANGTHTFYPYTLLKDLNINRINLEASIKKEKESEFYGKVVVTPPSIMTNLGLDLGLLPVIHLFVSEQVGDITCGSRSVINSWAIQELVKTAQPVTSVNLQNKATEQAICIKFEAIGADVIDKLAQKLGLKNFIIINFSKDELRKQYKELLANGEKQLPNTKISAERDRLSQLINNYKNELIVIEAMPNNALADDQGISIDLARVLDLISTACQQSPNKWAIFFISNSFFHWKVIALVKEARNKRPVLMYLNSKNTKHETEFIAALHPLFIKALEENKNCAGDMFGN